MENIQIFQQDFKCSHCGADLHKNFWFETDKRQLSNAVVSHINRSNMNEKRARNFVVLHWIFLYGWKTTSSTFMTTISHKENSLITNLVKAKICNNGVKIASISDLFDDIIINSVLYVMIAKNIHYFFFTEFFHMHRRQCTTILHKKSLKRCINWKPIWLKLAATKPV